MKRYYLISILALIVTNTATSISARMNLNFVASFMIMIVFLMPVGALALGMSWVKQDRSITG